MIKQVRVPVCAVCGAEWLPTKPEWRKHPELITRCTRCKSRRWNDDDPAVSKAKTITATEQAKIRKTAALKRRRENLVKREKTAIQREQAGLPPRPPKPVVLCRHRVLLADCPICRRIGV